MVAWEGAEASPLERAGVPFRRLEEVVGPEALAAAEAAGRTWARVWGRLPLVEGRSFRDLVEWREASLLWAAESFLRDGTAGPRLARTADLCLRLLTAIAPAELDAVGLPPADAVLLARASSEQGVLFHDAPATARALRPRTPSAPGGLPGPFASLLAPRTPPAPPAPLVGAPCGRASLLALVAAARDAAATRPLLEAVAADLGMPGVVVPLQEMSRWETRRVWRATAEAEAMLQARLESLRGTPGLRLSYTHRGVSFADLAAGDLEALLLGHLPGVVRLLEAAIELLDAAQPALVLLAVPGRDERRTLLLAARAAGVPAATLRAPAEPLDAERKDGGPQPAAAIAWEPGSDTSEALARLREVARGRVGAE